MMPEKREALTGLAIAAAGAAAVALIKRFVPPPEPKPWGSAFWLDPELWDRVPMRPDGTYGACWNHLNGKVVQNSLAHKEPTLPPVSAPKPLRYGDTKVSNCGKALLIYTMQGWMPFAYPNVYDNPKRVDSVWETQTKYLWYQVLNHGWVKSGHWDRGVRCTGCWSGHTPGYHPDGIRGPSITKPSFAEWMPYRWRGDEDFRPIPIQFMIK